MAPSPAEQAFSTPQNNAAARIAANNFNLIFISVVLSVSVILDGFALLFIVAYNSFLVNTFWVLPSFLLVSASRIGKHHTTAQRIKNSHLHFGHAVLPGSGRA
ncbi:unknown [Clostridium sp. CAG:448]|nr:unknown [Clostridium sp. CAG:448]